MFCVRAAAGLTRSKIELVVADMAGTVINEGGVVYETLRTSLDANGVSCPPGAMRAWHGARKEDVIRHFVDRAGVDKTIEAKVITLFDRDINRSYFGPDSKVQLMNEGVVDWIEDLRQHDIDLVLNTGYPPDLQQKLVKELGLRGLVSASVSAYEVPMGRPYPYMIFRAMELCGVKDVRRVAKVGDTVRDVQEGINAGCGAVVGVLSGADTSVALSAAGANLVAPVITDLDFL